MVAEIERDFHARVPASNNQHFLPLELLAGFIVAGVDYLSGEVLEPGDIGHDGLCILAGGYHEPLADVLHLGAAVGGGSLHPPHAAGLVVLGGVDALVEVRGDAVVAGVVFQVVDELFLGWIFGVVIGKRKIRQLAKLLWEVQLKPIVGALLPQRGNAIGPLENDIWHTLLFEAGRNGQPRGPGPDYYGAVYPHASPGKHVHIREIKHS